MKAIVLLKDYRNIDFGCNVETLHSEIDEAISEIHTLLMYKYLADTYLKIEKCKEWAMSKGFQITSGLSNEPAYRLKCEKAYSKVLWYEVDDIHREYKDMYFMANTEVEAVIKASEYILKEHK